MKKTILVTLAFGLATGLFAGTVDISVDLKFDNIDYVAGERIRIRRMHFSSKSSTREA